MELFIAGSTARTAAGLVGVHRNTAACYFHHLCKIIACELAKESDEVFAGEIEVDESYFGGEGKVRKGSELPEKSLFLGC
jgi:transposase